MVRNKLHWDANNAVGLSKQRKAELDWHEFLCHGRPIPYLVTGSCKGYIHFKKQLFSMETILHVEYAHVPKLIRI